VWELWSAVISASNLLVGNTGKLQIWYTNNEVSVISLPVVCSF
jgi:hypothetical protein